LGARTGALAAAMALVLLPLQTHDLGGAVVVELWRAAP
jgi:hypothetical protein